MSSVVRILFGLLALGLFASYGPSLGQLELERRLLLLGAFVTSAAMSLPLGRLVPASWDARVNGPSLVFVSKLVSWSGASALPWAVATGRLPFAAGCAFALAAGLALWTGVRFAAWAWYAIAALAFGVAVFGLVDSLAAPASSPGEPVGDSAFQSTRRIGRWIGAVLWSGIGYQLARETRRWQLDHRPHDQPLPRAADPRPSRRGWGSDG